MRTAKCGRCGTKGLAWAVDSKGARYLIERVSRQAHHMTCSAIDHKPEPVAEVVAVAKPEPKPEPVVKPVAKSYAGAAKRRPHKQTNTLLQVAALGINVMLVGPAGSGKTTAAGSVAELLNRRYFEMSCGPATSQWDLLGFVGADGATYRPGFLREPYEGGGIAALDEIDSCNPAGLVAMNTIAANGHASFPDGSRVARHADFGLVACANTYGRGADRMYVGRSQLDAATLDRFAVIDWDYDEDAEIDWAGVDMAEWVGFVQTVRHIATDHRLRIVVSPRASINGARMLRAGMDRAVVAEMVLWKGMGADDRAKITANLPAQYR